MIVCSLTSARNWHFIFTTVLRIHPDFIFSEFPETNDVQYGFPEVWIKDNVNDDVISGTERS